MLYAARAAAAAALARTLLARHVVAEPIEEVGIGVASGAGRHRVAVKTALHEAIALQLNGQQHLTLAAVAERDLEPTSYHHVIRCDGAEVKALRGEVVFTTGSVAHLGARVSSNTPAIQ